MENAYIVTSATNGILKVFNNKSAAEHYVFVVKKKNPEIEGVKIEFWSIHSR